MPYGGIFPARLLDCHIEQAEQRALPTMHRNGMRCRLCVYAPQFMQDFGGWSCNVQAARPVLYL